MTKLYTKKSVEDLHPAVDWKRLIIYAYAYNVHFIEAYIKEFSIISRL